MLKRHQPLMRETKRLLLVPMTLQFVSKVLEDDPTAYEDLGIKPVEGWPSTDTREIMPRLRDRLSSLPAPDGFGAWLFVDRSDDCIVGDGGFKGAPDDQGVIDIGYGIIESRRRQGFAYEAVTALIEWGFSQSGVKAITADCSKHNTASLNLLRKLGMVETRQDDESVFFTGIICMNHEDRTVEEFDFIIVGAGMGGLSAANFLARYHKRVLVLEKHNLPGGLVTSFARRGVHFDLGIHGLYELKENQAIPQFLEYWGAPPIETVPCRGDMHCYIDGKKHVFRHGCIKEDFERAFPAHGADVEQLFSVMETINTEMFSGSEAPEPPYDMNLLQLIRFGMKASRQKPLFMKYGNKDAKRVLDRFTDSAELKSAIYSYCPYPMVFMAFAYQWGVFSDNEYPRDGMQAIPNAAVTSLQQMGGVLKLNTEVTEILVREGCAYGVRTRAGDEYHGKVISNVSPHYTYRWITAEEKRVKKMQQALAGKKVFPAICALFMAVDDSYDLGNVACITIGGSQDYQKQPEEYTEATAPMVINIYPKRDGDAYRPLVVLIPLAYGYEDGWQTDAGNGRGAAYQALKQRVEDTILNRMRSHLGNDFMHAVVHYELATPITYERYTYSQHGSFMGWSVEEKDYGKYMKQRTEIKDLYLVGQWVFPGFGVAGVMASGYYLAKEILKGEGIDLKKDFVECFSGR